VVASISGRDFYLLVSQDGSSLTFRGRRKITVYYFIYRLPEHYDFSDDRVCLCVCLTVCLSVSEHIPRTTCPNFRKKFVCVLPLAMAWSSNSGVAVCNSDFVDSVVMFADNWSDKCDESRMST